MSPLIIAFMLASGVERDVGKEFLSDHRGAVIGATGGAVAGFAMGAGGVLAAGYVCKDNRMSCFGSDDAPLLGAFFLSPIVGVATAVVGGVIGGIAGAAFDEP